MTLASTIEINDGSLTPTGIVVVMLPGSDPTIPVELWRAADAAGVPDVGNAVMIASRILPPGGIHLLDQLPTDGTLYWYRQRLNGNAVGPGPYTDWVNLGAADRLSAEALRSLDTGAERSSAAWDQQTARPGTHTQQMLPNFGAEDGLVFWVVNSGAATVITDSTKAHSGNRYFQVTSTTGVRSNIVAADDAGRKRWFEVSPGDVVQWGGWVYRESGTDNCQVLLQTADKDQASVLNYVAGPNNTAAYVFVKGQLVIPAGIKYVTVFCDSEGNGTATVARFDDVFLRIAFGASTTQNVQGSLVTYYGDNSAFHYSSTSTSISIWCDSGNTPLPDGSTVVFPATGSVGSPAWVFTGLTPSTSYHFGAYVDASTYAPTVLKSDVSGGAAKGSVAFLIQQIQGDGRIPLFGDWVIPTPASGGGSGGGGGGGGGVPCPLATQLIETCERGLVPAGTVRVGEHLRDSEAGWNRVLRAGLVEAPAVRLHVVDPVGNPELLEVSTTHRVGDVTGSWRRVAELAAGTALLGGARVVRVVPLIGLRHVAALICERHRYRLGLTISHNGSPL